MFLQNGGHCFTAKNIMRVPCTKLYRKIMTAFSCRKINNVHYNVTVRCFYTMKNNVPQGGGGGTRSINDGGSGGASYCEPKKIHEPEIVHPKKYLASTFSTSKSARPSISILIYSVKQT